MDILVTTEWLAQNLEAGDLRIVDASYHLPASGRNAHAEYCAGHIPGALFLDLGNLADNDAAGDNTLPDAPVFAARMEALGISRTDRVVLYDNSPLHSSARGWFIMQLFGMEQVAVLDGGLARWEAQGRPVSQDEPKITPARFEPRMNAAAVRDKDAVLANLSGGAEQMVDARSAARFTGQEKEARPGMASGHIPGARNLPIGMLYEADGRMKDKIALRAEFEAAGIDPERPVITSCGSGVTAAVLFLALTLIGNDTASLYDGSWAEWGADPATPKATGRA
ncbi:3-mercaptopyruvate sulfurtransferase [Croceicoccus sp. F390]|uniref:Sulfurtransferase n=1 Tax=Croceicoccus esteveae TaxID=3075597 RepID=A0ABU2ZHE7_9SPHN|nr:3-mercaptopyruvate sulfurtransferase [Croceicoccus sp. F390]MDT0575631.1 3-mercaptopyruvate sulfurtransferase [Croceicoccus sp. F390]